MVDTLCLDIDTPLALHHIALEERHLALTTRG